MAEIFADEGMLLWIPGEEGPTKPYWKAFMVLAVETETMEVGNDDVNMVAFFDKDDELQGIQIPEPIDDTGAPVEGSVTFLSAFLDAEEVATILDHVREVNSSFLDFENQQFMEIVKDIK